MAEIKVQDAIPFITTTEQGEFVVDKRAVDYLEGIEGRIAIVAVAGPWRTGKSFLLNQLLGVQDSGFVVGPTINACTKGIWLWGEPIVLEDGLNVVFMDTEGLGSTSRSQTEDVNIFSLALLLSSYFIWNSRGVIDGNALEDFGLVVNITKHIHVRSNIVQNQNNTSLSEVEQLASYFPSFLWVVRDFALRLEEDGRPLTDRQYLEKALKPQGGFSEDAAARNQVRHLLGSFFPDRDCTTLVRPAEDEAVLRDLMRAPPGSIRPEFAGALRALKKKVFGAVRPKGLHGRLLSGPMVATLARAYVKGINSGGAPTISSAWERVLESQAEQAVAEALERYGREMARRLGCPLGARGRPDVAERVQEYQDMERAGVYHTPLGGSSAALAAGAAEGGGGGEGDEGPEGGDEGRPWGLPAEPEQIVTWQDAAAQAAVEQFLRGAWGQDMKGAANKSLVVLRETLGARLKLALAANEQVSQAQCAAAAAAHFAKHAPPPFAEHLAALAGGRGGGGGGGGGGEEAAATAGPTTEEELAAAQGWLLGACEGLERFAEAYAAAARGPARWPVFATLLADRILPLLVGWGRGAGAAQRRACAGLRAARRALEAEVAAARARAGEARARAERAGREAERAVAEREARCEGEQAVVRAQAEAAAAQLAQSRAFLEKLEAAHAAVAEVLNEQCSLTEQLAEELRETAAQMEAPPPSAAAAHENGDDDSDEEETTVWDVKAQVSASETEIRMLRQEIDLKEQHLEANMRLLDIKEKELREVEYQWGMTKASNAAEVDDMGEVEEEIDALYRIARGLKGYLSWTTPFGRLPLGLAAQLTPEQKAVLEEISAG